MEAVNRHIPAPARLLSLALTAGLVVWSASQFAGLLWHVAAPDSSAVASDVQRLPATIHTTQRSDIDVNSLQEVFVLSAAGQGAVASDGNMPVSAVETRLALVLKGAVLSSDNQHSRAIIASGDSQQFYRPGDTVLNTPGTVVLQAIYQSHVVLDNNGRQEVLRMDDAPEMALTTVASSSPVAVQAPVHTESPARPDTNAPSAFAGRALTDLLRIQPMFAAPGDNSTLLGLQIRHGSRQDFLSAVGLQQGDVITAIDGQRLDDASRLPELMAGLSNARQVSLSLLRDGQDVQLQVNRDLL